MGRVRRYRERIEYEMRSVLIKGVGCLVERTLREEFGRSRIEAEVLAATSVRWLLVLGAPLIPGRTRLSVPSTRSKRYASQRREVVTLTVVDVPADAWAWRSWGLVGLQRSRVVRWLLEIHRQGGFGSLAEVAAWANMTPSALANRLAVLRECGVWLPHVGGTAEDHEVLGVEAWLLDRYLTSGDVNEELEVSGVTQLAWEDALGRMVVVVAGNEAGVSVEDLAGRVERSVFEVQQALLVTSRHATSLWLRELRDTHGRRLVRGGDAVDDSVSVVLTPGVLESELVERYGFSVLAAQLYRQWLTRLAFELKETVAGEGEFVFFAIDASEGARVKLNEAKLVPVRLSFFTSGDAKLGPRSDVRTRVAEMKFARIHRFATQACEQGALLTLPDLAVLTGMHIDAIRHHLSQHPDVVVPTRGRMKDIGRSVTHKTWIVELYLQMHTETEIRERTQHSYESIEVYLREFTRVLMLADQGMNAVMIRRVTNRSLALVNAYLELYERYDKPEHHFRLSQLRQAFTREDVLRDKKGGRSRSRTEDSGP